MLHLVITIPICNEFAAAKRLLHTNGAMNIHDNNFLLGVLYGTEDQLSTNYRQIMNKGWNVIPGKNFWHHLTGDPDYYEALIETFSACAQLHDKHDEINELIHRIAEQL